MKKIIALLLALVILLGLTACGGEKRIVHCDRCGEAIEIEADSKMDEDWIIMCGACNEELYGEEGLVPTWD